MSSQKIRIKLKSYDQNLVDQSAGRIAVSYTHLRVRT